MFSGKQIVPVILCGGIGSRLWPLSRQAYPKQFVSLGDTEKSLLQETVERARQLDCLPPVIVTNEAHRFMVADHLQAMGSEADIILEPQGRNTAAAITAAALFIHRKYEDAHMLVLPSDHIILEPQHWRAAVKQALEASEQGLLVTFGITPQYPETGYGYIHYGDALAGAEGVRKVGRFVEKPDAQTAQGYVESGEYAWNSGMFLFTAETLVSQMGRYEPFVLKHVSDALQHADIKTPFVALAEENFSKANNISIDYALMERSRDTAVVPVECGWSDAGAWDSLWRMSPKDPQGNHVNGKAFLMDTKNSYIRSDSNAAIATLGMEDAIIIATNDVVLVADKSQAQNVKELMKQAQLHGDGKLAEHHTRVYRPWGHYETIEMGKTHQVKHIEVKPKARLSVQKHHHRAEHWVIVSGKAKVRVGDSERILSANEYVHIPLGDIHCIENIGPDVLKFIEVQHGDYLGEDDIVRYDDLYGRVAQDQSQPERKTA